MAVDAGVDVDQQVAAGLLVGHCLDPFAGFLFVQLDAQALRRLDDPGDGGAVVLDLRRGSGLRGCAAGGRGGGIRGRVARFGRLGRLRGRVVLAWLHDAASFACDGPTRTAAIVRPTWKCSA